MNIRQIKETCIYTTDLNAAKKFYHDLLGLPVIGEAEGRHIFLGQVAVCCCVSSRMIHG